MRIVALDLVRFFAAMSVVLYHYISPEELTSFPVLSQLTDFGYLGVPLFFIISGYVIALSANNRTPWEFASSRAVRLYPALWAGILFTTLISTLLTNSKVSLFQVLSNATLLNDYLGYENIDGVYWTLKAELKFYACMFILLLTGVFHQYKIWLSLWMLLTISFTFYKQPFFMGWFISPEYSSFFIAGICYYLIQSNQHKVFASYLLAISLITSLYNSYQQISHFVNSPSQTHQHLTLIIISLFYYLFLQMSLGRMKLKQRKIYVTLGALTYPLYLIHNLAGKEIIAALTHYLPMPITVIIVILFMLSIAYLIHYYVENKVASPLKSFLLGKSLRT